VLLLVSAKSSYNNIMQHENATFVVMNLKWHNLIKSASHFHCKT
jgi:hypothetical protein